MPARLRRRGVIVLGLWVAALAVCLLATLRARYVADLSAFLPAAPTPEQAVLLDQLKNGATSRLVLLGIEGSDAAARIEASRRLATAMRASGLFASVNNGDTSAYADAGRVVFAHRYAFSPAVEAARFTSDGLRTAIDDTVSLLGTPAGSLIKPILFRDPTGETLRIAEALTPANAPRSEGGVWVSRSAPRAVLVATTQADGGDLDAQQATLHSIRTAFAGLPVAGVSLRLSGPAVFGVGARDHITSEVERLAIFGSAVMIGLLLVAFASLRSLLVAMLPVGSGVLAGIAAVSLGYGQVHAMTLGFGTTLIGEAVDYAIYYLTQMRAQAASGEAASQAWLRESWPTVRLGLFTSLIGFAALVFAGFPGLAQLGVFSIAGLCAAAATTRYVLPVLAPAGAPGVGLRRRLGVAMLGVARGAPRLRWPLAAATLVAAAVLAVLPSAWHGDLMSLSPIDPRDLAYDAALRADVGAPDGGTLVAVSAASEAAALSAAEAAGQQLDGLVRAGLLQGYDSPARWLPSPAVQEARRAALPDAATLSSRLASATEGGPLEASRLGPFLADVEAARKAAPFGRELLAGTPLAAAVEALLLPGDASRPWRALVNLQPAPGKALDDGRIRAAIAGVPGARLVAIKPELDALYARYLREAEWQASLGAFAVLALLAWHLRNARRLLAVLEPIVAAPLLVLAALVASGTVLGILHLVGLLLTVAIGSNYALFFDHLRQQARPDPDTLASLLLANLTTVASFGLLATSQIPVLQAVGIVVAPGALLCLLLSAAFIGDPSSATGRGKIALP